MNQRHWPVNAAAKTSGMRVRKRGARAPVVCRLVRTLAGIREQADFGVDSEDIDAGELRGARQPLRSIDSRVVERPIPSLVALAMHDDEQYVPLQQRLSRKLVRESVEDLGQRSILGR